MHEPDWRPLLSLTAEHAAEFLEGLPDRRVRPSADVEALRRTLAGPLPEDGMSPAAVVTALARDVDPGVMASPSGRFFGFVIGGALPAAVAADWLTTTWDQNAGLYAAGPAAAVVEETAIRWLIELLGLPDGASGALVTGCQMAHVTCLLSARHAVLERVGWDVERQGLIGAPPVRVIVGEDAHATLLRGLRIVGFGSETATIVPTDADARMDADAVRAALVDDAPTIVCVQAGDVNTGGFDPIGDICDAAHERGAWVHVDGAFGLWANTSSRRRHLVAGVERADSWASDAHKWLNVPYDCGLAFTAHPEAHRAAIGVHAAYLVHDDSGRRDSVDWTPEFSRRARAFTVHAAIRSLGRRGVTDLVDRCCDLAERFAAGLRGRPDVEIRNEVALNQVLVRFLAAGGDHDARTREVVRRVQEEGTCWLSGTTRRGEALMRISVSNWSTDEADVDASLAAICRCADEAAAAE